MKNLRLIINLDDAKLFEHLCTTLPKEHKSWIKVNYYPQYVLHQGYFSFFIHKLYCPRIYAYLESKT